MGAVIMLQAERLTEAEIRVIEERVLASKRQEIENYISLALTSIRHIYETEPEGRAVVQHEVKRILHDITFGGDGYFFIYDEAGMNLVHPKLTHLVGKNWWNLQDPNGDYVIRNLIDKAKSGGGFHRYVWNKPTTGQPADKIGYAVFLDKWKWMFGTGLYLDDIAHEVGVMKAEIEANIREMALFLFLLTFLGVVIVAVIAISVRFSEQRFADSRLKQLTNRIVDVQEDERKRVSTELHDGISQLLVSIKYTLDLAATKARSGAGAEIGGLVEKAMAVLDDTINEVRRISKDLRPSILDDIGLASALASLGNEFSERSAIAVKVDADRVNDALSDEAKTALFRVVQEALTNVSRHAEAKRVDIRLMFEPGWVRLTIADDGKGLTGQPAAPDSRGGLGIRNMLERVEALGGKLTITSAAASGTQIEVVLPSKLKRNAAWHPSLPTSFAFCSPMTTPWSATASACGSKRSPTSKSSARRKTACRRCGWQPSFYPTSQ